MSSEIFVQLNTRSGMAYFYDAKLPEDAVENAPEGTIFIPIDKHATIDGNKNTLEFTDWYIIRYVKDRTMYAFIVNTESIDCHIPNPLDGKQLVSIDRLSAEDFDGTPFFIEIGDKDNDIT